MASCALMTALWRLTTNYDQIFTLVYFIYPVLATRPGCAYGLPFCLVVPIAVSFYWDHGTRYPGTDSINCLHACSIDPKDMIKEYSRFAT